MQIIDENPFRVLGVYVNSPLKTRVSNISRINAFARVGKAAEFASDMNAVLPRVERDEQSIAKAQADLTLSKDKFRYGLFWFVEGDAFDNIALQSLASGDKAKAEDVWSKSNKPTAFHNLTVLRLINSDLKGALSSAAALFGIDVVAWSTFQKTLADDYNATADEAAKIFLDTLLAELKSRDVLAALPDTEPQWRDYAKKRSVDPIIKQLNDAVNDARSAEDKYQAQYDAGLKLMKTSKPLLAELKQLLPVNDMQYAAIADKVGLTVLQCGINFFNNSPNMSDAHKAKRLQDYAMSVVVGRMAKDRCAENVQILNKLIAELPPEEVEAEVNKIHTLLHQCDAGAKTVTAATRLLTNAKPLLLAMKGKVGANNVQYLKISTVVVNMALNCIIEAVNVSQKNAVFLGDRDSLKSTVRSAWNAIQQMSSFDMEPDFKRNRYDPNRSTLNEIRDNLGISFNIGWRIWVWIVIIIFSIIYVLS